MARVGRCAGDDACATGMPSGCATGGITEADLCRGARGGGAGRPASSILAALEKEAAGGTARTPRALPTVADLAADALASGLAGPHRRADRRLGSAYFDAGQAPVGRALSARAMDGMASVRDP